MFDNDVFSDDEAPKKRGPGRPRKQALRPVPDSAMVRYEGADVLAEDRGHDALYRKCLEAYIHDRPMEAVVRMMPTKEAEVIAMFDAIRKQHETVTSGSVEAIKGEMGKMYLRGMHRYDQLRRCADAATREYQIRGGEVTTQFERFAINIFKEMRQEEQLRGAILKGLDALAAGARKSEEEEQMDLMQEIMQPDDDGEDNEADIYARESLRRATVEEDEDEDEGEE